MKRRMLLCCLLVMACGSAALGSEMVLDRQGGWEVVQADEGNTVMLCLAETTAGTRGLVYTDGVAIGNITAHQRFPWNGLVDIDYEVFCEDPDTEVWVEPEATDGEHGGVFRMETLSGDGGAGPVGPGRHRMTWDAKADNPGANSSALVVKMKG